MSYILILIFSSNTYVAFDIPSKEECANQAAMLAQVIQRRETGKAFGSYGYSHQCWPQSPILIELADALKTKELK